MQSNSSGRVAAGSYRSSYHSVSHPSVQKTPQMPPIHAAKEVLDVQVYHPATSELHQPFPQSLQRLMCAAPRPESVRAIHKVLLVHRRPFPSPCAGPRGGEVPQAMVALRQRGVFDVVRPHACAVAQADRCGAGWRPVSTMQRCAQTHRRRGSAPGRDRDAQGC